MNDAALDLILAKLTSMEERFEARFQAIETRLDAMGRRMSAMEGSLTTIETKVELMDARLTGQLNADLGEVFSAEMSAKPL